MKRFLYYYIVKTSFFRKICANSIRAVALIDYRPSMASILRAAFLQKPSNSVFLTELWLRRLTAVVLLFTLFPGCSDFGNSDMIKCNSMIPTDLDNVHVSYKYGYDDSFGSTNSFWYVLEIKNDSNIPLENLRFKINHLWWASLKDLMVNAGFFRGYRSFGETSFPAKKKIRFVFSPETKNNLQFKDLLGNPMSEGIVFNEIRLHSKEGVGTFRFPEP